MVTVRCCRKKENGDSKKAQREARFRATSRLEFSMKGRSGESVITRH